MNAHLVSRAGEPRIVDLLKTVNMRANERARAEAQGAHAEAFADFVWRVGARVRQALHAST